MKSGKIKIIVTYALLLYFLCFVIPPVSSIIPFADSFAVTKDIAAIGKDKTRERMYLFDLTLWEILKSTKRSYNQIALLSQDREDLHQQFADQRNSIIESDPGMPPFLTARSFPTSKNKKRCFAGFQFAHSGLSPPVLA